jgi:hypothetical protein
MVLHTKMWRLSHAIGDRYEVKEMLQDDPLKI